jgi:hypothetical protein
VARASKTGQNIRKHGKDRTMCSAIRGVLADSTFLTRDKLRAVLVGRDAEESFFKVLS